MALTQCVLHGADAETVLCPPPGTAGAAGSKVFWWHASTPVFPFAAGPFVTHGPLTEADDLDVEVPGITRPLAHVEV